MTLLDVYLDAVRKQLPRRQRDDIVAELRAVLLSQVEEAQEARSRDLTDDEVAAILKRYGSPDAVAASYGAGRHLIGPRVYPHYIIIVKLILWVVGGITALAVGTAFSSDQPGAEIARALGTGALIAFGNLTIVTLIFARVERVNDHLAPAGDWDPHTLPAARRARTSIRRSEAWTSLGVMAFWLLWWTGVLPINRWLLWNRLPLEPAPIWEALTPMIVGLMIASIVADAIALLKPRAVAFYERAGLLIEAGALLVLATALQSGTFLVVTDPSSSVAGLASVLNRVVFFGLIAWAVVIIASIGFTVRRWLTIAKHPRETAAAGNRR
jgi:hypothetical protein